VIVIVILIVIVTVTTIVLDVEITFPTYFQKLVSSETQRLFVNNPRASVIANRRVFVGWVPACAYTQHHMLCC
jgi:hypothetical protein